jgi:hypothetical protein
VIGAGIGEHEHAGLVEALHDLVRVGTGSVAAGDRLGAGVLGVLEHRALAVGPGGLHHNIGGVLDRDENARGEHELVPGLAEVHDVDAILTAFPHVALHLEVAVLGAEVATGGEHHLDVRLLLGELRQHLGKVCFVGRRRRSCKRVNGARSSPVFQKPAKKRCD